MPYNTRNTTQYIQYTHTYIHTIQYIHYIHTYIHTNTHTHTQSRKVMKISCVNFKELFPSTKYFSIIRWSRRREVSFKLKKKRERERERESKVRITFFKKQAGGTINEFHFCPESLETTSVFQSKVTFSDLYIYSRDKCATCMGKCTNSFKSLSALLYIWTLETVSTSSVLQVRWEFSNILVDSSERKTLRIWKSDLRAWNNINWMLKHLADLCSCGLVLRRPIRNSAGEDYTVRYSFSHFLHASAGMVPCSFYFLPSPLQFIIHQTP